MNMSASLIPDSSAGEVPGGRSWRPERPFNQLPPLPPAQELETREVLKHCIEARAALAGLQQAALLIPNQSMLINTIPVLEARDSSGIENIVTTADDLFRHASGEGRTDPATKEALRYRQALYSGFASLNQKPLCTATAVQVCSAIKGMTMDVRRVPGTQLANDRTGEVIYTPPEGEATIRTLLANWERFLHEAQDIDPLVRMAVGHYQFEAIHPFTDGNGRTGRVLNNLFLVQEGLLNLPILYLSCYIIAHKADYYRLLLGVTRDQAWLPWVIYMLKAVAETSAWTTAKINAVHALLIQTSEWVKEREPGIYSRELIDVIFEQPYCRISNVVDKGIAKRQTASRYLHALVSIGVLTEEAQGQEKLFVNPRLMQLLKAESNTLAPCDDV